MKELKGRLTFHEENGDVVVRGMNETNQDEKIYACIFKLKDYEDLGFNPSELEMILRMYDDLVVRQDKLLATIERYQHSNKLLEKELKAYRKAQPSSCPLCHKPNFKNDKYCSHCGQRIRGV